MTDLDKIDAILDWQTKAIIEAAITQDLTGKKIQITEELVKKHKGAARQAIADLLVEARIDELRLHLSRTASIKTGESWDKWDGRTYNNINARISELKKGIK